MKHLLTLFVILFANYLLSAQGAKPKTDAASQWHAVNRTLEFIREQDKQVIRINEAPDAGLALLAGHNFKTGTITFDVKGKNVLQQSFVGIAFHIQDEKTYDAIYFRPFNFMNADTARRWRSVQYVSMPEYPWEKLRAEFPGKYENKVNPVPDPDGWFHVVVTVTEKKVEVFVNGSPKPSLEVEKLTGTGDGRIGFWVGNGSGGSFANLKITPLSQ